MAQSRLPGSNTQTDIYEVDMLATSNGQIVDAAHPLPVTLGNSVIQITSNSVSVSVPNTISVNSSSDNPVHVHITEVGASGNLTVSYMPVGGNVSVNNLVSVSGTVNVGNPVSISGSVNANVFQSNGSAISNTNPLPVTAIILNSTDTAAFEWQVAMGKITTAQQVNIFGYSNNVSTNFSTIWENTPTDYVFLSSAQQLTVNSSISTDDSCKVAIAGLNSTWDPITEVVTLNGVTPVTTANSFLRVNSMTLTQPGAGQNTNIGHIVAAYNGNQIAVIDPLIGKSQMSIYSVANGYSLYVQNINMFSGDAAGASKFMNFRVDVYNSITNVNYILLHTTWQNAYQLPRSNPFKYGQKQDIKWQLATNSGTYSGSGVIEGTLIKDQ